MNSSEALNLSQEPLASSLLTVEQKERLGELLDRYLSSLENGTPIDPDVLVEEHPDLQEPLREYLNSLEQLHHAAAGFANGAEPSSIEAPAPDTGTRRLGDFVLGRELGRGGMGVVYEAHQLSLDRRVALKVLPFAAVLDSKQIARFKTEAQAAAQILHPNIVPVFAVGVDRGVHFYAMQLIDGQPLDRAIAELRKSRRVRSRPLRVEAEPIRAEGEHGLSDEEALCETRAVRVERTRETLLASGVHGTREQFQTIAHLGVQAAKALHAAHEHGIVHRDVKPSNLLLDAEGKLWVTDFGLARCQRDATFSKTGDVIGTMRYMSPEQASGQASLIDQRTDVYSLGVTLYELLTLRPAVQGEEGPELLRQIDREPKSLRKLNAKIPVALENVVLKAIARRREERYTTAQELADDLQRFLDGRPTFAKPPTSAEWISKWASRHKRVVATAVFVSLLACIGLGLSTILITREKLKTEQNYRRAEQNLKDAQEAVDRFGSQFAERLASVAGAGQVRHDMLQETLTYYRRFAEQAADDPSLQADLALTYSKMGSLADQMGSTDDAITSHAKAIALFEKLIRLEPAKHAHRQRLALCRNNLALTLQRAGRVDEARQAYQKAIKSQTGLVRRADDLSYVRDLAISHTNLGLLLSETQRQDEAKRCFREAIRLQEQLVDAAPKDALRRHDLAATYNNLSTAYLTSDSEQAEQCYLAALGHLRQALDARPGDLNVRSRLASTYNNLGSLQSQLGQYAEAAASNQEAIELQQALVESARYHNGHRRDLAISYNNFGLVQSRLRNAAGAEYAFRQALTIHQTLVALNPNDIALRSSFGGVFNNLGIVLEEQERLEDAAEAYQDAIQQQQFAHSRAVSVTRYRFFLSKHYFNLGRVLRSLGRNEQAVQAALQRRRLWPNDPDRLVSVAEEFALASASLPDSDRAATLALDTLEQAIAAGGRLPADFADREAFAALKDNERFPPLTK